MYLAGWSGTGGDPIPAVRGGIVFRHTLFGRLGQAARITEVSAPAGSGKTVLLRSWIAESDMAERAAWVAVQRGERDPQRFWIAVADALRATAVASALVRPLTAAPDLDGWAVVERLLADLGSLEDRVWLVIDDVHELASAEALRQLEMLVLRGPPELRFVLATRHDAQLGLHRLRLEGQLTEIRAADLQFTLDEARALFESAGVQLPDPALARLVERTEGWAAGLRLAALSLSGHPDPERFAEEFSGSERTVAGYLLAEVLDRQPRQVRRLLLRTSLLERVSGELADLLTGGSGGGRVLQDLEQAGAFVVSLDAARSWFRYHQMFADLLQLELRRTAPEELPALHGMAARWFAGHGYPVEAVRHARAAQDWDPAARLLSDHWVNLFLDEQGATAREFPAGAVAAAGELTALMAADKLIRGSPEEAERHLAQAAQGLEGNEGPVPAEQSGRLQIFLAIARLWLARRRGDLPAVVEEAQRLLTAVEAPDAAPLGLGEDLRALAMITLGIAEVYAARLEDAGRHLEQGVALAHRIGRPYLELTGLAHRAHAAGFRSYVLGEQWGRQAIDLARRHGWGDDQPAGVAYAILGGVIVGQGRLAEAEPWLERAGQTLRTEAEPAAGMSLHHARGLLELARGRNEEALSAFQAADRLAGSLITPHILVTPIRARMLQALVRMGQTKRVQAALAGLDARERRSAEMRTTLASLWVTQHDPQAATAVLAPVTDGSVQAGLPSWMVEAFLLEAIARDALGDPAAASRALERALDLAEPEGSLISFLIHPAPELLERHARHATAHPTLVADILSVLSPGGNGGTGSAPVRGGTPGGHPGEQSHQPPGQSHQHNVAEGSRGAPGGRPPGLTEPLSQAETRVLRYLPTNLTAPEIAGELHLSLNTVKTHMRHLYAKLGTHRRRDAVDRARALGLLIPSPRAGPEELPSSRGT